MPLGRSIDYREEVRESPNDRQAQELNGGSWPCRPSCWAAAFNQPVLGTPAAPQKPAISAHCDSGPELKF